MTNPGSPPPGNPKWNAVRLVYVHDPMCSWCWGFARSYRQLTDWLEESGGPGESVKITRLLGGLAPDSDAPMPPEMRRRLQATWRSIEARVPGTRFNHEFWTRCQPRRSTWPACRAVIAARRQGAEYDPAMTEAIQRGYYLNAKNPSDDATLIALADELGLRAGEFADALNSDAVRRQLQREITTARQLGIHGFPSLLLLLDGTTARPIPPNYTDAREMLDDIAAMTANAQRLTATARTLNRRMRGSTFP